MVPALVVMLYLGLKLEAIQWMDGPVWWYEQKDERAAQMWKGGMSYFGKGRAAGFPMACSRTESRSLCCAEDKPGCKGKGGMGI